MSDANTGARPVKRLTRSTNDSKVSGVCGGIAEYLEVDANLIRLLVVLGTVLGLGGLAVVYVAAWVLMPRS